MKKNELVPVGNGESFTRCGWIRLALKTLFEDPHASFFVETIPLCVQLNLIVLLRLAIVGAFSLEIPRLFAVILGLFITTLIYSTSVAAKLWFLSPTRLQKIGVVIILCGGLFTQMKMVLFAPNIQTSIINEFISTVPPMLFQLSLDHNTSFKKGSNGWKEFLQWDKEIKDSMVAKFVALYPYEELAVIQNSKNDGISRRQQLNNRVKYAEACLQDSKWLLRDDFLRLAFLDYLVTEPPENSDKEKKDSMEIIRDFANREGPILERCRLKPYDPDKDALTQDFVRTLENK